MEEEGRRDGIEKVRGSVGGKKYERALRKSDADATGVGVWWSWWGGDQVSGEPPFVIPRRQRGIRKISICTSCFFLNSIWHLAV